MPSYAIGGINRYVIDLCSAVKSYESMEQGIYVLNAGPAPWKTLVEHLGLPVYEGDFKGMDLKIKKYANFKRVEKEYDIIHWHTSAPLVMLSCARDGKRHIFTHHSVLGKGRKVGRLSWLKWFLFKRVIKSFFAAQVFNSKYTRHFWKTAGVHTPLDVTIYNGIIPRTHETNAPAKQKDAPFIIGTACSFIAWKRVDLLIDVFASFTGKYHDAQLLLVGDGQERVALEKRVGELGLNDHVVFTGFQDDVWPHLLAMDVFVSSSTTETFGLAALEAMSLGCPALCFHDGGGITEVMKSEDVMSSVKDMVCRLEFFYDQKKKSGSCRDSSYSAIAEKYTMTATAERQINLYKQVTGVDRV